MLPLIPSQETEQQEHERIDCRRHVKIAAGPFNRDPETDDHNNN
jgi:hypothetical protein